MGNNIGVKNAELIKVFSNQTYNCVECKCMDCINNPSNKIRYNYCQGCNGCKGTMLICLEEEQMKIK